MDGWIKIHRQIQSNKIWNSEPFSRGQAWVDLLLLANHKSGIIYVRDHKITVERGQVGMSENRLSNRWKWSRTKVRKFLKDLEKEQQIKQEKSQSYSIITIENYNIYQQKEQEKEQQEDNSRTTAEQQKNINKNVKNEKKVKNIPFSEFWNAYGKKEGRKKAQEKWERLTAKKQRLALEHVPKYVAATPDKTFRKLAITYLNNETWTDEELPNSTNGQYPRDLKNGEEDRHLKHSMYQNWQS